MSSLSRTLLLSSLLCATLLPAQDRSGWSGAISLAQGTEGLRDLTGQSTGFSLEGAYTLPGADALYRFGVSVTSFSDGTHSRIVGYDGLTPLQADIKGPSLRTYQVYAALKTNLNTNLNVYWGLSANRHLLGSDLLGQGGSKYVKGTKLGLRADLEDNASRHLSALLTFQAMELGVDAPGSGSVNPSWFQFGVRWHF